MQTATLRRDVTPLDGTCYSATFDVRCSLVDGGKKPQKKEKNMKKRREVGREHHGDCKFRRPGVVAWQPGQPNLIGNSLRPGLPFHQTKFLTPLPPSLPLSIFPSLTLTHSSRLLRRDSKPRCSCSCSFYHPHCKRGVLKPSQPKISMKEN